jgi:hypothetical protein
LQPNSFVPSAGFRGTITINDHGTTGTPSNPADPAFADDTVDYNPDTSDPNFFGNVSFTYVINDTEGTGANSTATVTVQIQNVNDSPVANSDAFQASIGGTLAVGAPGVLGNDSDVDNNYQGVVDPQTAVLVNGIPAGQGTLVSLGANGGFTFVPPANPASFGGNTSFTYQVKDSANATSGIATVSIHIAAPPTAVNDGPFTATEDTPLSVAAPDKTKTTIYIASGTYNGSAFAATATVNGQLNAIISVIIIVVTKPMHSAGRITTRRCRPGPFHLRVKLRWTTVALAEVVGPGVPAGPKRPALHSSSEPTMALIVTR